MRLAIAVLIAGVAVPAATTPAAGAGLTRAQAERAVERKVRAKHTGFRVDARCSRSAPRRFSCTYVLTTPRCPQTSVDGRATVAKRSGERIRVRLRGGDPVAFCDRG